MNVKRMLLVLLVLAMSSGFGWLAHGAAARAAEKPATPARAPEQLAWEEVVAKSIALTIATTDDRLPGEKSKLGDSVKCAADLAKCYEGNVRSSARLRGLTGRALNHYYLDKAAAASAPQATQVATDASVELQMIQIQQNQRIIELLEKLTATRK